MSIVKIQGHASGTGTLTVTAPNTSTNRTLTLPDTTGTLLDENSSVPAANLTGTVADARISALTASKLTGALPAISGASLTGIAGGRRNIIINGAMQVWQRATAATAATTGFQTVDRWKTYHGSDGAYTLEQSVLSVADRATTGCTNALLAQCTTVDASLAADQYAYIVQPIEAQNLSHIGYGAAGAKDLTLSFWVKKGTIANGSTFSVALKKFDSNYYSYQQYTIDSDNWERKTLTYPGLTAAGITTSDNTTGAEVRFILATGSNYHGTVNTWSTNATEQSTASQFNFLSNTSNDFYITGVQLEVGSVATDFEHRSYGEELALCQRYFEIYGDGKVSDYALMAIGANWTTTNSRAFLQWQVEKRAAPTVTEAGTWYIRNHEGSSGGVSTKQFDNPSKEGTSLVITAASAVLVAGNTAMIWLQGSASATQGDRGVYVDAEL